MARTRDRWVGVGLFGSLATALVLTLWLRESSAEQNAAHLGQLFPGLRYTAAHTDRVLGWVSAVAGLALLASACLARTALWRNRWLRTGLGVALVVLVLVAGATWGYAARGIAQRHYIKAWDSFHYLLGAKYFDELGYFGLYDCVAAADLEGLRHLRGRKVRDLRDYDQRLRAEDAAKRGQCMERFTEERWAQFKRDYAFYASLSRRTVRGAVGDHGYNGTPAHAFVSGLIANRFELDYGSATLATLIDSVGILLMFGVLSVAFGWRMGAVVALLFFTLFTDRGFFILGSFVRYQWLVFTGLGLAALGMRRHMLAGACLATAGMLNVFPVLFLGGPILRGGLHFIRARTISAEHRPFVLGLLSASLLWGILSVSHARGVGNYREFFTNMHQHTGLVTSSRVGLRYTLGYYGATSQREYSTRRTARAIEQHRPIQYLALALLLGVYLVALPRMNDVQASVLGGVGAFFALFGTVEYYYGIFAFIPLMWTDRPTDVRTIALWAVPFLCNAAAYWVYAETGALGIANNTGMSCAVLTTLLIYGTAALGRPTVPPVGAGRDHRWLRRAAGVACLGVGAGIAALNLLVLSRP